MDFYVMAALAMDRCHIADPCVVGYVWVVSQFE